MNIQYYPGHMTKAKRQIQADLKLVDAVIELLDARAPYSTQNPDIRKMTEGKKRLIILNKADLADPVKTELWMKRIREKGDEAIAMDSRSRDALSRIKQSLYRLSAEKRERDKRRGILVERPLKCLVTGIPNVGKSTLINTLAGKASAKTGDKPGVTRGNQWLSISDGLMLLDTPGVLWPKFSDEQAAVNLALIGSINDSVLNTEELSMRLISYLDANYPDALKERYDLSGEKVDERLSSMEETPLGVDRRALCLFGLIAENRCALKKGGEPDFERTAKLLISDLRSGRLGRITLETKVLY